MPATIERTCKTVLVARLEAEEARQHCRVWLIASDFNTPDFTGYSENCIATRLPELAKAGILESRKREGKQYKEWALRLDRPKSPLGSAALS